MTRSSDAEMKTYYRARAPIYDRVYAYPERQDDLRTLETLVAETFQDLEVLEVAAGTGYWTQYIAPAARSVLATDATTEALQQIAARPGCGAVDVEVVDAYALAGLGRGFDGCFAGLWLSHVPRESLAPFMDQLHSVLRPGATVLLLDNSTAQCTRLPIIHTDALGNTYQDRPLDDGSVHRVLKNFPSEQELRALVGDAGHTFHHEQLEHFWVFGYRLV